MRIAIFGAGGVGGYLGARLACAGHPVSIVARGEHLRALRRGGVRVQSVRGDLHAHPLQATDRPEEIGPVDAVLLAVKTWQLPEAVARLGPLLGSRSAVVTLQNGVEAPEEVAKAVGRERVIPGLARIFSYVQSPGVIRHLGGPSSVTMAEWEGGSSPRVEALRRMLEGAGVPVECPDDIVAALWAKFLFVVPLGGLGSVTRAPVGVLRGQPETRALLREAMEEIARVAAARGVALAADVVERTLAAVDAQPADGTSSLQRDVAQGRRSELDAWTGAVVRLGAEAGVATPLHRFLLHSLLPLERRARGEIAF